MWNGFSMISKRPELTEGMMQTLTEAERTLLESPGNTTCLKQHKPEQNTLILIYNCKVKLDHATHLCVCSLLCSE